MKLKRQALPISMNIYRTRLHIVKQHVGIQFDNHEYNVVISHDIYYKRNKQRDKEYEFMFKDRKNIDGKRIKTSMYTKTYVE